MLFKLNKNTSDTLIYAIDNIPKEICCYTCSDYTEYIICQELVYPLYIKKNNRLTKSRFLKSFIFNKNKMKYTITIKPGMYWDDNSIVVARDYVNGIKYLLQNKTICPIINLLIPIKNCTEILNNELCIDDIGIKEINTFTFEIMLDYPMAYLKELFSTPYFTPYKYSKKLGRQLFSGPYILKKISKKKIILSKNSSYTSIDEIRRIEYVTITDIQKAEKMFYEGNIDITCNTAFHYEKIRNASKCENFYSYSNSGLVFLLHIKNKQLRKIVKEILDRKKLSADFFGALKERESICTRNKSSDTKSNDIHIFNNFKDKVFTLYYSNYYPNRQIAEKIQQELETNKICKLRLSEISLNELSERIFNSNFDFALSITYQFIMGIIPSFYNFYNIFPQNKINTMLPLLEDIYNGYNDKEKMLEILINESLPFITLLELGSFQFVNSNLMDFTFINNNIINLAEVKRIKKYQKYNNSRD